MKLQDELIHRKGIAKARVSVYAELCRAQVWLLGKNIPTQIINDFVNEFIEPANKLAQEALDAWNESEPEVKLRNLWNQWSEWSDKQLPENCEEFAEWYFYQITGTEVYHERADQNWVYQKLAENCGFESKDKVERIINQLKNT